MLYYQGVPGCADTGSPPTYGACVRMSYQLEIGHRRLLAKCKQPMPLRSGPRPHPHSRTDLLLPHATGRRKERAEAAQRSSFSGGMFHTGAISPGTDRPRSQYIGALERQLGDLREQQASEATIQRLTSRLNGLTAMKDRHDDSTGKDQDDLGPEISQHFCAKVAGFSGRK